MASTNTETSEQATHMRVIQKSAIAVVHIEIPLAQE